MFWEENDLVFKNWKGTKKRLKRFQRMSRHRKLINRRETVEKMSGEIGIFDKPN